MLTVFETVFEFFTANAIGNHLPQRLDVNALSGKFLDLVLLGAEHRVNLRLRHPLHLRAQAFHKSRLRLTQLRETLGFLVQLNLQNIALFKPLGAYALGHLGAGDLVNAHQHRLGLATVNRLFVRLGRLFHQAPTLMKVLYEVAGHIVQVGV